MTETPKQARCFSYGDSIMSFVKGGHFKHEVTSFEDGRLVYREVTWEMSDAYWIEHGVSLPSADQRGKEC